MSDENLKKLVESNARAIEALTANVADLTRDRAAMYQLMADLIQAEAENKKEIYRLMADLIQAEAENKKEMYRLVTALDSRQNELARHQGEIINILKLLTQKKSE